VKKTFEYEERQEEKNPKAYWLGLAFGGVNIDDEAPMAVAAIFNVQYSHNLFSARVVSGSGFQENKLPHEKIFDAGLLYGYGIHDSLWYANISAGLAYVTATKRNYMGQDTSGAFPVDIYEAEKVKAVGIPWQIQIFSKFSSSSKIGLGLFVCGDINKPRSFFSIQISLDVVFL
jgi:hypothetical protein